MPGTRVICMAVSDHSAFNTCTDRIDIKITWWTVKAPGRGMKQLFRAYHDQEMVSDQPIVTCFPEVCFGKDYCGVARTKRRFTG